MINLDDYLRKSISIEGISINEEGRESLESMGQGRIVYKQEAQKRQYYLSLDNNPELIPLVEGSFSIVGDSSRSRFKLTLNSKIGAQR